MNSENIFESISYIDNSLIERSESVLKRRRFVRITKLAASAAAALVLTFGGLAVYNAVLADMTSDSGVPPIIVAEINGTGYCREGSSTGDFREAYGLPEPNDGLKGEFVGSYDANDYGEVNFYEIRNSANRRLLMGERGGELSYWTEVYGGASFETVRERLAYNMYHIVDDVHSMRVDGKTVGAETISEVWKALCDGMEITEEEYTRMFQGEDYDEANAQEVYSRHADAHRVIEFNYGELTYLRLGYYTDIDCFDGLGYIVPPAPVTF